MLLTCEPFPKLPSHVSTGPWFDPSALCVQRATWKCFYGEFFLSWNQCLDSLEYAIESLYLTLTSLYLSVYYLYFYLYLIYIISSWYQCLGFAWVCHWISLSSSNISLSMFLYISISISMCLYIIFISISISNISFYHDINAWIRLGSH